MACLYCFPTLADIKSRFIVATSGLIFGSFLSLHLVNILASYAGPDVTSQVHLALRYSSHVIIVLQLLTSRLSHQADLSTTGRRGPLPLVRRNSHVYIGNDLFETKRPVGKKASIGNKAPLLHRIRPRVHGQCPFCCHKRYPTRVRFKICS